DVELEAEEPDGAPEATIRTGSQRPFAERDFPMGFYEAGERDLEALRRQERIREAESKTSRTKTLGKVVDRLKALESEENATLRKKLAEMEVLLDLTRMERDRAEKRFFESIWWNERFYLEMVHKRAVPNPPFDDEGFDLLKKMPKKSDEDEGPSDPRASGSSGAGRSGGTSRNADGTGVRGAKPTVPELTGCTYATFIKCDPLPFNGTKGAVGFMSMVRETGIGFPDQMKAMGIEAANNTPWSEVRK
nr:hypothetical protein [Tanacetum cinerariifolium]